MTDLTKHAGAPADTEDRPAHPDPNRGAPRPKHMSDEDAARPDMDHPPRAQGGDRPVFDRGTEAADEAARNGGISREGNFTPPDTGREDPGAKGGRKPPSGNS